MTDQLEKLITLIQQGAPAVPFDRQLMSPEAVAKYLDVSKRTVIDNYMLLPDFPKPMRLPSKGKNGMVRWRATQIVRWAENRFPTPEQRKTNGRNAARR